MKTVLIFALFTTMIAVTIADYNSLQIDNYGDESAFEASDLDRSRRAIDDDAVNVYRYNRHRRKKPYDPYAVLIQDSYIENPIHVRYRRSGSYKVENGETCWSISRKLRID